MRVLLGSLVMVMAATAYADPPGMTQPAASPGEADPLARDDAAATHGFAFDSGLVLGRGDVAISLLTLVKTGSDLGVAVGVGGGVELSADGIDALGGRYYGAGASVRARLLRGPKYAFSIAAGYHWTSDDGGDPFGGGYLTFGGDLALAVGDRVLLSFGLGIVRYGGDIGTTNPYAHADLVYGRSWLRLLVELGDFGESVAAAVPAAAAAVGVRLATRHVSVDLGLAASMIDDLPLPSVVFGLSVRP